jgi:hypothetical protein
MFGGSGGVLARQILILGYVYSVFSQQAAVPPSDRAQKLNTREQQLVRLRDSVVREAVRLSTTERVGMYASLARIWKKQDLDLSKEFLRTALDQSIPTLTDGSKERSQKLACLRKLLAIAEEIDPQVAKEIIKALESKDRAEAGSRTQNSIALTEAALSLIGTNLDAAFRLAVAALNSIDTPSQNEKIYGVILSLAIRDAKRAEEFFLRVLKLSKASSDREAIARLALFTSPKSSTLAVDFLSDPTKKVVLDTFLQTLAFLSAERQQEQVTEDQKERNCNIFLIGNGLRDTFIRYLPDRTTLVSQLFTGSLICPQGSSRTQSVFDAIATRAKDLNVDELLKLATGSTDPARKSFYFSMAIGRLSRDHKFEEVIEILDQMDEGTKKAMGGGDDTSYWTAMRISNGTSAVLQRLENADFSSAKKIIEKTPADCRASVQVEVGRSILGRSPRNDSSSADSTFAMELLADARQRMSTLDPFLSVNLYLTLVRDLSSMLPDEAPLILREMVKAINRADTLKENDSQEREFAKGSDIISLPALLLQNEEFVLYEIQQVQKPYTRVRLKLGLLNSSMQEYRKQQESP